MSERELMEAAFALGQAQRELEEAEKRFKVALEIPGPGTAPVKASGFSLRPQPNCLDLNSAGEDTQAPAICEEQQRETT